MKNKKINKIFASLISLGILTIPVFCPTKVVASKILNEKVETGNKFKSLVNDAGITTTGAASENNELPKLVEEFAAYNDKVKLWQHHDYSILYEYNVGSDGSIVRTFNEKKDVLTW